MNGMTSLKCDRMTEEGRQSKVRSNCVGRQTFGIDEGD